MTHFMTLQFVMLAGLFALGVQMFYLHTLGSKVPFNQTKEEMRKHIVWKLFYINPDDPRAWLPKLSLPGHTVNFRTRGQAVLFSVIIAIVLGSALASTAVLPIW